MSVTPYERIVLGKFRSQANFCRLTGIKAATVSAWAHYSVTPGLIPQRRWPQILAIAEKNGIALSPEEFLETYGASKRKRSAA